MTVGVPVETAATCATCGGGGAAPGTPISTCGRCNGSGHVQQVARSIFGELLRQSVCPECSGSGRTIEQACPECRGNGRTLEERELEVQIPAGIHDGQRIRLGGEGHMGSPGGRAGDLYVAVHVRPDERFVREGNDIFSQVDLTIVQAAIGATSRSRRSREPSELEFDAGTQPGEVRVLRGKGMPVLQGFGHGDHRVLVNVTVPRHVTPEQRTPPRRVRRVERRAHLSRRSGLLREAQERLSLIRVTVTAPRDEAEPLRARFLELAPDGFEEVEVQETIQLAAYGESARRVLEAFPEAAAEEVADDWSERWRVFHRPARIGPLWVGPPWLEPPRGALAVVIDPGQAFGTGAHPTSRLCLELLLEQAAASVLGSVLDIGCGSGVLAIAAARLGLGPVLALDIDEVAVRVTIDNAAANGVRLEAEVMDARAGLLPETELALANVSFEVVEALAGRVEERAPNHGRLPRLRRARAARFRAPRASRARRLGRRPLHPHDAVLTSRAIRAQNRGQTPPSEVRQLRARRETTAGNRDAGPAAAPTLEQLPRSSKAQGR